jgi:hypothetical protein
MVTASNFDRSWRRLSFIAFVGALVAAPAPVPADEPEQAEKLPEGVTAITNEQLKSKVPNFFAFDYPFQPQPGKRLWLRVDAKVFVERYPDGTESRYEIIGHTEAHGMTGTIVAKVAGDPGKSQTENNRGFQVFIPDRGNEVMAILFRDLGRGQPEWRDMAWSLKKKTILQKVE